VINLGVVKASVVIRTLNEARYLDELLDSIASQQTNGLSHEVARGHLAALQRLAAEPNGALLTVNLGTGKGISVLELVAAFERASGKPVPYQVVARRSGDVASCYADPALAKQLLGWQAELGVDAMCADTWRWQAGNPRGYGA
jgi:UDP-glucose 4-epimerase